MRSALRQFARTLQVNVVRILRSVSQLHFSLFCRYFDRRTYGEGNIITNKFNYLLVIIHAVTLALKGGVCHAKSVVVDHGEFDGGGVGDLCRGGGLYLGPCGVGGHASRGFASASIRALSAGVCKKNKGERKAGAFAPLAIVSQTWLPARNIARAHAIAREFRAPHSVFGTFATGTLSGAGHP